MQVLHFSLNNLSMMALILSIGFVVDDAIVMLENIVRHMEAGEAAARGGAEGIAGDRLHDPDDDHVARRGVHPDSVHERHPRPAVPRVRGHHHDRDPHLRHRLDHADADAVQPLPARRPQQEGVRRPDGSRVRRAAARLRVEPGARPAPPPGDARRVLSPSRRRTVHMFNIIPTGFIPDRRSTTRCSSTCRRRRARRSTTWPKWTQQVGGHRDQEPSNVDSFLASVGGGPRRRRGRRRRHNGADHGAAPAACAIVRLTAQQIAQQMRPLLLRFPGFRGFIGLPPSLQIGGRMGNQNYSIMMQAMNTDDLYAWAPQLEAGDRRAGVRRCRTSPPTWR